MQKEAYAQIYHHKNYHNVIVLGSRLEKNAPNGFTVYLSTIKHAFKNYGLILHFMNIPSCIACAYIPYCFRIFYREICFGINFKKGRLYFFIIFMCKLDRS
jgi:hypothetical protein